MSWKAFLKPFVAGVASALVAAGCATREADNSANGQRQNPVKRTGPLTPVGSTAFSLAGGPLQGKQIMVDLATTPDPASSWGTTACLPVLVPDFELGRATCSTGETRVITAAMA